MPKSIAERVRNHQARRIERGEMKIEVWVPAKPLEARVQVRKLAANLCEEAERSKNKEET